MRLLSFAAWAQMWQLCSAAVRKRQCLRCVSAATASWCRSRCGSSSFRRPACRPPSVRASRPSRAGFAGRPVGGRRADDARLVDHLLQHHHVARNLQDQKVVVVAARPLRRPAGDAALSHGAVGPGIGTPGPAGAHFAGLRSGWQAAVRRVDDQRRSLERRPALPPEVVVGVPGSPGGGGRSLRPTLAASIPATSSAV